MASNKPQKGYLYTWNFFDGFLGLPKRRIHLKDTKPALLHVAYLGGGERWDNEETPSGALLILILSASTREQQSSENCYKFYGNYDTRLLEERFDAKTEELSGGGSARWSIEFNIRGWAAEQIDAKIEEVLKWHCEEIKRIKDIESLSL